MYSSGTSIHQHVPPPACLSSGAFILLGRVRRPLHYRPPAHLSSSFLLGRFHPTALPSYGTSVSRRVRPPSSSLGTSYGVSVFIVPSLAHPMVCPPSSFLLGNINSPQNKPSLLRTCCSSSGRVRPPWISNNDNDLPLLALKGSGSAKRRKRPRRRKVRRNKNKTNPAFFVWETD